MNRHGQSRARYEDDILAFLMDGMLEEEGRALLEENERLNADPAAAIPAELDERCRALLQSAFPDEPLKKPERVTWKIMKRVLIAAVLAATLFATAYAAVPEFRAGVLNFFTRVDDIGTHFSFYSSGEGTSAPTQAPSSPLVIKDGMPFEFSYVPEGYELYSSGGYDRTFEITYIDGMDDMNNFSITVLPVGESASMTVDTEDAIVQDVTFYGWKGMKIHKIDTFTQKNQVQYVWLDGENKLFYSYFSLGITSEESQRIFDGIVIYGYDTDTPAPTPAPSNSLVIKDGMPFEFSYVPEGYEISDRGVSYTAVLGTNYTCIYVDPDNSPNNFAFQIGPVNENTNALIDTEDAQVTEMKIRGYDGYLIQKTHVDSGRNIIYYLWFDLENELMFRYVSVGIPFEESQRIFDGIVIYE